MKNKIYIAGPLNAQAVDYLRNVSNMMTAAEHIRRLGYSVYVPCIDLLMGIKFNYDSYTDYFDNSQPWLAASDAVYLCDGWQNSKGTLKEIELAESLGIPVFTDSGKLNNYFSSRSLLDELLLLEDKYSRIGWEEIVNQLGLETMTSKPTKES